MPVKHSSFFTIFFFFEKPCLSPIVLGAESCMLSDKSFMLIQAVWEMGGGQREAMTRG